MSWGCKAILFSRYASGWKASDILRKYLGLIIVSFLIFISPSFAAQNNSDRWFANDKYEHFAVSAFYTAGIAKVAQRHFEINRDRSIFLGAGFTISLGALKEGIDNKFHKGKASHKDFIWDIAGAFIGGLVARLSL